MLVIDSGFANISSKMFDIAFFATLQQGVSINTPSWPNHQWTD